MDARNDMPRLIRSRRPGLSLERPFHTDPDVFRADKEEFGMKPVACESVAGYVFICLAGQPAGFTPFRTLMEPCFAPRDRANAKVAHETTIVEKGNRKPAWENNRERHHCAANHPELCKTFPEAPTVTGIHDVDSDPGMQEHWAHCEAAGLPSRFRIDDAGQYRATRAPRLICGDVEMNHNRGILEEEVAEGYILACCSRPLSAPEIEA